MCDEEKSFNWFNNYCFSLLFPRRNALNDGGTIEYKAVVYKVSKVHRYKIDGKYNNNFENGIIIEVFGKEIYNNVK